MGCWAFSVEKPGKNPALAVGLSPVLDELSAATCWNLRALGMLASWAFSTENAGKEWPCAVEFSLLDCWNEIIFLIAVYKWSTFDVRLAISLFRWLFIGSIALLIASETNVVRDSAYSAEKPAK